MMHRFAFVVVLACLSLLACSRRSAEPPAFGPHPSPPDAFTAPPSDWSGEWIGTAYRYEGPNDARPLHCSIWFESRASFTDDGGIRIPGRMTCRSEGRSEAVDVRGIEHGPNLALYVFSKFDGQFHLVARILRQQSGVRTLVPEDESSHLLQPMPLARR